ncbi:MAG: Uma2 family endonuclease [Bauldia sp.]|nr:Uma2 family endonuclease [Bauldia sp.]
MNVALTHKAEGLERRAFTIADVERMVEAGIISPDERLEILGGEIVPMSPKGSRHELIKNAINRQWGVRCPQRFGFVPETGLRLSSDTYLEPDFIVYELAVGLIAVKGPNVLLAVEVADASLGYDLGRKPAIYAEFGVHELWVIDAVARKVHVFRGVGPTGYAERSTVAASDRVVPAVAPEAFAITLDALPPV